MFLSRMALDLTRDETFPFLHSPQLQYQMIQNAFTQDFTDFLWRTDYIDGRFWVVILSSQRPTLLGLHSQCGFEGVFPSWEKDPEKAEALLRTLMAYDAEQILHGHGLAFSREELPGILADEA